ncbi:MAG TPA: IS21-like element helper ATPase IstB [Polyangiaceae bacterium]|nr:IS21-like element helper ATPase IstB [Polyangiaceae bacterium]
MLNEETIQKLLNMKLLAMAAMLRQMATSPPTDAISIEETIGLLVDHEWTARENKRLERLLKDAHVPPGACIEDVACDAARGIDKPAIRAFASCQWARAKQNVIVLGATGVGKTFLGGALAQSACRHGLRALCVRTPRLLQRLAIARAEGSYAKELARLEKIAVLVLDDFLLAPMSDVERRDLLEVLEDRYDRSSTVITSQLPTKSWHQAIGDATIADAICDRLVHNAHVITLRGGSMRKKKAIATEGTETKN